MQQLPLTQRKKSRKPIYILFVFLSVFLVFVWFITRPSLKNSALRELQACFNIEDVKQCWYKYKADLADEEEFLMETRKKIASLSASDLQIEACKAWLPPPPTSLNLIIVPDLSNRIIDTVNNPDQVKSDTALLNFIWRVFVDKTKLKKDSKDRLVLDVTDEGQAGGRFRNFANELLFDLSEHKNQSNRLYFDKIGDRFQRSVAGLYSLALQNPIGADYHNYFENKLPSLIKQSTLFDNYRNVLVIITDGYLEAQSNIRTGTWAYTGTISERNSVSRAMRSGQSLQEASIKYLRPIQIVPGKFSDLEILVIEVHARTKRSPFEKDAPGTVDDYAILRHQWTNWFSLLGVKNANDDIFIRKNDATTITKNTILEFLR
jgi:hypothetical protein